MGTPLIDRGFSARGDDWICTDVLYAWRDRQQIPKWEQFDFKETNASCLGLDIQIGDVEQFRPGEVSIWYTSNSNACEHVDARD